MSFSFFHLHLFVQDFTYSMTKGLSVSAHSSITPLHINPVRKETALCIILPLRIMAFTTHPQDTCLHAVQPVSSTHYNIAVNCPTDVDNKIKLFHYSVLIPEEIMVQDNRESGFIAPKRPKRGFFAGTCFY
jgi:hypothetical protein